MHSRPRVGGGLVRAVDMEVMVSPNWISFSFPKEFLKLTRSTGAASPAVIKSGIMRVDRASFILIERLVECVLVDDFFLGYDRASWRFLNWTR